MEKEKQREKIFVYIVAGIYLLLLCWLILFKLADSIDKIPSERGINLIPFWFGQLSNTRLQRNDIVYNILAFIPAGFYFSAFGKKKVISGIFGSLLLSLCFEVLQWIFALGASDITDLIMNTVGGVLGTGLYYATDKLFKGRQVKVISIAGAVLEGMLITLIVVLSISNSAY